MNDIKIAHIYFTEGENNLKPIMAYLHEEARVKGVTVFRGISGFGQAGCLHSSSLLESSFELPLIIEFFDHPKRIDEIIADLKTKIEASHIVSWQAQLGN